MRKIGTKQTATMSQAAKILNAIFKTRAEWNINVRNRNAGSGGSWRRRQNAFARSRCWQLRPVFQHRQIIVDHLPLTTCCGLAGRGAIDLFVGKHLRDLCARKRACLSPVYREQI